MDILHTIIIKVASVVSALFLFIGNGQTLTPRVTVVEIQDNKVVITESTTTPQKAPKSPSVAIVPTPVPETVQAPVQDTVQDAPVTAPIAPVTANPAPQTVYVPVYIIQAPEPQPTAGSAPLPTNSPTIMEPEKTAQILIKNPLPGKGYLPARQYFSREEPFDASNEMHLGAVLLNPDGSVNITAEMTVVASEESQNKVIKGTGNVSSFGDPNNPQYYYPYHYIFHEPEQHKITFTALGVSESITVDNVTEDPRP